MTVAASSPFSTEHPFRALRQAGAKARLAELLRRRRVPVRQARQLARSWLRLSWQDPVPGRRRGRRLRRTRRPHERRV
jgi:hypothetical protein